MERISLNHNWAFQKLPSATEFTLDTVKAASAETAVSVNLPHTWHSDDDPCRGLALYQKRIAIENRWEKLFIDFEGVEQRCKVFVGETEIGVHQGSYAAFRFEIPAELRSGNREITISVLVDNRLNDAISPLIGDFTVFGGIYRPVSLMITNQAHFDYAYYGTNGIIVRTSLDDHERGVLQIEPHIVGAGKDTTIRYDVFAPNGEKVLSQDDATLAPITLTLDEPALWQGRKDPALYTVQASLRIGDQTVDETSLKTGFRRIEITPDEGVSLNHERIRLNGVALHQDFADVFNATTSVHLDRNFALIEEIGANSLRLSHYQHPQAAYDRADQDGYLVWAEIPMLKMTENPELFEDAKRQLTELILQNVHHPSIYCWGIQNEIGMFQDAPFMHEQCRALSTLAKELDPNRCTAGANLYTVKAKSQLNAVSDLVGYNIYFGWYYGKMEDYDRYLDRLHERRPEVPFGISEYGVDANPAFHSEIPQVKDYSEEYQALFHETVYPIFESKDYLWGSYVWNLFDFSSARRNEGGVKYRNMKGLVSYDRELRKDAFYYYKAKWSKERFIHICATRFMNRTADAITLKIYTNLSEVTLSAKSETRIGKNDGNGTVRFENLPLFDGVNRFTVSGDGITEECEFHKVASEDPSYRLPDSGDGMVRNWFLDEDNSIKEGFYSINDTANDLLNCEAARKILEKYLPDLVNLMVEKKVIPLGLPLESILKHNKNPEHDSLIPALNNELNQIPSED